MQGLGQCSFLPFPWAGGTGEAAEDTAQLSEVVSPLQPPLFAWGLQAVNYQVVYLSVPQLWLSFPSGYFCAAV